MADKPRIGITTSLSDGRQTLDTAYARAVEAAGGIPVIVPLLRDERSARDFAALLDGLIISGGPGITRGLIGDLPADLPPVDDPRDSSDALIYRAMSEKPFLGICYGMQFANAMAGGAIYGDAQAQAAAIAHTPGRGGEEHTINIVPGSRLSAIYGASQLQTNSYHIQAVAELGAGLQAVAHAADGVIEALESADGRVMGAQFHPERMDERGLPLFADLAQRARSSR